LGLSKTLFVVRYRQTASRKEWGADFLPILRGKKGELSLPPEKQTEGQIAAMAHQGECQDADRRGGGGVNAGTTGAVTRWRQSRHDPQPARCRSWCTSLQHLAGARGSHQRWLEAARGGR